MAGVAVNDTEVPLAKEAVQPVALPLQLIPAGFEVTVPEPPTDTCKVSV